MIGVVFLIGAFQLVLLLLWWNVHTLSKLEQQQQPEVNSSYLSIPSGSIEVPYDAKAFLRGRVSLGAKDCHNALGKKGWDYVVRLVFQWFEVLLPWCCRLFNKSL